MSTIFTYLEEVQYDNIYDKDFSALDILMLTELSYLNYQTILPEEIISNHKYRLLEIDEQMNQTTTLIVTKERRQLLSKMAETKRYKNIKAFAYVDELDLDSEKQFAALTFQIKPDTYLVAFRGTDDSIIGWKEDFHMTYMSQIPAQLAAVGYLEEVMNQFPGNYIISGHSKGGNLAIYSASQVAPTLQKQISAIYSYGAPGLNKSVIESDGYQAIQEKIEHFIPQGSIVGMMLEVPNKAHIVESTAIGGIAQHNTFSWKIENQAFVLLDKVNPDSLQTDQALKTWTACLSDQELKDFFDLFFNLILDAEIYYIEEVFSKEGIKKISTVIDNARSLSTEEKELLTRLLQLLFNMRYQAWREDLQQTLPTPHLNRENSPFEWPNLDLSHLAIKEKLNQLFTDSETPPSEKS